MVADAYQAGSNRESGEPRSLRERISGQAEEAIGKLADDLLENPVINSALQHAFGAREKVSQAQETAMEALNLPSASNLDKLARRLRSISQRLDDIEDAVEKLDRNVESIGTAVEQPARLDERLDQSETRRDDLGRDVAALRRDVAPGDAVSAAQTRAVVPEG
jgi:peptidoglycan hydrolase CwlO-like protein